MNNKTILKRFCQAALLIAFALIAFVPALIAKRDPSTSRASLSSAGDAAQNMSAIDTIDPIEVVKQDVAFEQPFTDDDILHYMSLTALCGVGTPPEATYNCTDGGTPPKPISVGVSKDCSKCKPVKAPPAAGTPPTVGPSCEGCCAEKGGKTQSGQDSCKQFVCGIQPPKK